MQTTESLKRKIKSAQDLQSVVKTMKALAAVSIRQYQKAVESLVDYNRNVEMGLQAALKYRVGVAGAVPMVSSTRIGAIVFGSDQGLCGPLNENIANHALEEMAALGVATEKRLLITIGVRVNGYLEDAGQNIVENSLHHAEFRGRHRPHGSGFDPSPGGLAFPPADRAYLSLL